MTEETPAEHFGSVASPSTGNQRLVEFAMTPEAVRRDVFPSDPVLSRFKVFPDSSSQVQYQSNVKDPPSFDGRNFKLWVDDLFLWVHTNDIKPSRIAALVYTSVSGRAKYVLNDIPKEILIDDTPDETYPNLTKGLSVVLDRFKTHFGKPDIESESFEWDRFTKLRREGKFFQWPDFISEFRLRHQKLISVGISIPNEILVHTFVRNSLLSEQDGKLLKMTLAARDLELKSVHIDRVMELSKTLFENSTGSNQDSAFQVGKGKGKGQKYRYDRYNLYSSPDYTQYRDTSKGNYQSFGSNYSKGKSRGRSQSRFRGSYDSSSSSYTGNNFPQRSSPTNGPSSYQQQSYPSVHSSNKGSGKGYTRTYSSYGKGQKRSWSKGKGSRKGKRNQWSSAYQSQEDTQNTTTEQLVQEITNRVVESIPQSSLRSLVGGRVQDDNPGTQSSMMVEEVEQSEFVTSDFACIPLDSLDIHHVPQSKPVNPILQCSKATPIRALNTIPNNVCFSDSSSSSVVTDKASFGILDTACTSSVCSTKWLTNYKTFLESIECPRQIKYRRSNSTFRFANDSVQKAEFDVEIPVIFGSQEMSLSVTVLGDCTTDLLISRLTMEELELCIDFASGVVHSDYLNIHDKALPRDQKGNLLFPLYWTQFHSESPEDLDDIDSLDSECVHFIDSEQVFASQVDYKDHKTLMKLHLQFGHASARRLYKLLYHGHNRSLPQGLNEQFIKSALEKCDICKLNKAKPVRPRFGGWISDVFNDIVCLDLVEVKFHDDEKLIVAHAIDVYSGFTFAKVIPSKEGKHVVDFLWDWKVLAGRHPRVLFTDNGGENENKLVESFCSLHDIEHNATASAHPWSNGLIERHNGIFKEIFKKIVSEQKTLDEDIQMSAEGIVSQVISTLNAIPGEQGYSPFFLAFTLPATPFSFDVTNLQPSQWVQDRRSFLPHIQARLELQKQARDAVFSEKIMSSIHAALKKRIYHTSNFEIGDKVYYWKYDQGHGRTGHYVGPCVIVGRKGNMRILNHAGKNVTVARYDLIARQSYTSHDRDAPFNSSQSESQNSQSDGSQRQVHFDDDNLIEVRPFTPRESSQEIADPDSPDTNEVTLNQHEARYSRIPGYLPHPRLSLDDIHALCIPVDYDTRKPIYKDIVMKVPGRLILNNEEHVRLQSMPENLKINHRLLIPDVPERVVLEVFEDPLTNCTIRINSFTGDKYVSAPIESENSPEFLQFFERVQPLIFKDQPHLPQNLPYSSEVIRAQIQAGSDDISLGNYHESIPSYNSECVDVLKEKYLDMLCFNEHALSITPVQSVSTVSSKSDSTNPVNTSVIGISSYRPPTRQERNQLKDRFVDARMNELNSWMNNGVFEILTNYEPQDTDNLVSSRWLDNVKEDQDGRIVKIKSRLVIRGFEDQQLEYLQKDAPTVDKVDVRLLLQYAINNHYDVFSGDITTAFLQGHEYSANEDRRVLVKPPKGTNEMIDVDPNAIWCLKKAAYGLADAPRRFYMSLKDALIESGLKRSLQDFAVFYAHDSQNRLIGMVVTHVDDILFTGSPEFHRVHMDTFLKKFTLGKLQKNKFDYCGSTIEVTPQCISVSQEHYAKKIAELDYVSGNPERSLNESEYAIFRTTLGKLTWLTTSTRPDLAFQVNLLSQNQSSPQVKHMNDLRTIVKNARYYADTKLEFKPLSQDSQFIVTFTDASLANNKSSSEGSVKHTSQTGTIILLASFNSTGQFVCNVIDWQSAKQKRVARSTLTAETLAMGDSVDRAFSIHNHIKHIQGIEVPIFVLADCKSLVDTGHSTTSITEKRLMIDLGAIREAIERREIRLSHISTQFMLADALTKRMDTQAIRNVLKYHRLPNPVVCLFRETSSVEEN